MSNEVNSGLDSLVLNAPADNGDFNPNTESFGVNLYKSAAKAVKKVKRGVGIATIVAASLFGYGGCGSAGGTGGNVQPVEDINPAEYGPIRSEPRGTEFDNIRTAVEEGDIRYGAHGGVEEVDQVYAMEGIITEFWREDDQGYADVNGDNAVLVLRDPKEPFVEGEPDFEYKVTIEKLFAYEGQADDPNYHLEMAILDNLPGEPNGQAIIAVRGTIGKFDGEPSQNYHGNLAASALFEVLPGMSQAETRYALDGELSPFEIVQVQVNPADAALKLEEANPAGTTLNVEVTE